MDFAKIKTEERNERTRDIDRLSTFEMIRRINEEDRLVAEAVGREAERIAAAVDIIAERMELGGRLIYIGSGTSGRLGILDAVECPPTFSTPEGEVIGLIAGGQDAVYRAEEGAEDDASAGRRDLEAVNFRAGDVLVGIAASGRTPYVLGAMRYAKELGAPVIGLSCSPASPVAELADIAITPVPGPEVITGSTRMKSGTAQKMVLNMLSTGAMIRRGKVYGNLMVDVKPTNEKLRCRARRIVAEACGVNAATATATLEACGYRAKTAIVMLKADADAAEAERLLAAHDGRVAPAVGEQ